MLSVPHLIIVFLVALLVLGPEKLPEVARTLSKAMGEFHRLTGDFQETVQREMRQFEYEAQEHAHPKASDTAALPPGVASEATPEDASHDEELAGDAGGSASVTEEEASHEQRERTGEPDSPSGAPAAEESGTEPEAAASSATPQQSHESDRAADEPPVPGPSETVNVSSEEESPPAGAEKPFHDHPTAA